MHEENLLFIVFAGRSLFTPTYLQFPPHICGKITDFRGLYGRRKVGDVKLIWRYVKV